MKIKSLPFVLLCTLSIWFEPTPLFGATSARLVSEWKFESNPNDTSGSANNGTVAGTPSYVPGRFGEAIYLNRADSIQKTSAANLPTLAADSWSANQWVYLTNAPDSLAYFSGFGNATSAAGAGTARALIAFGNPNAQGIYSWGSSRDLASGIAFPSNEWVMITITHNGANATRNIWINGVNVATNVQALANATAIISVGVTAFPAAEFEGLLDEFTLWRGVLSASDIEGLTTGTLVIAADPQSLTNSVGQPAQLVGAAVGSPPISYQWLKDGAAIENATSNVLSFASLSAVDAGFYSLVASNSSGSVTSAVAGVLVPVITSHPQGVVRYAGESARLSGAAAGASPVYLWLKDGVVVSGASSNVLNFPNFAAGDAGNYELVATNSFGAATSAVAVVTVTAVTQVIDGLAGYWNFDEGSGSVLIDNSGNGNDGGLINYTNDASWVAGRIGGALAFGGGASSNYVLVANYPKPSSTMTISAWVWADARPSFATILKNWPDAAAQQQFHFGLEGTAGDVSHYVRQQGGAQAGPVREGAGSPLPTNRWVHVAVVLDGLFMRLYRNGAPIGTPAAYNGTLSTNVAAALGIGAKLRSATLVDSFWHGKMDDLGLWSRGLSPDEILAIFVAGNNGQPLSDAVAGPVAPIISIAPPSQTVSEGATTSFTVSAAGTGPLTFQWLKNGSPIEGATNMVLSLTNSSLCAGDGGEFQVVVCNSSGCATSAPPAILTVAPLATTPLTDGLFAHWAFDEKSGLVASNSFGDADDGILTNYILDDDTQWVTGRIGGALNFGGPSNAHHVVVPTYPKPVTGMSAAVWVWADARSTWATIVKNWGGGVAGQFHFGLQDTGGDLSNFIQNQAGASSSAREGAASQLPTNSWQHVAFTADGTTMRIFRNGTQVGAVAYSGNLIASVMAPLGIGAKLNDAGTAPDTGSPGFWQGKLDDLGLWSRGLSSTEIRAIYNAGVDGRSLAQASALPSLRIVRSGDSAIISWPELPAGNCFTLESSDTLPGSATWNPVGAASLVGGRYAVEVSTAAGNRFYRLKKQ